MAGGRRRTAGRALGVDAEAAQVPAVERRAGFLRVWPFSGAGCADGKRGRGGLVGGGTVPMTARGRCDLQLVGWAAAPASERCRVWGDQAGQVARGG